MKGKNEKKSINVIDLFAVITVIAVLLGIGARIAIGRLSGPSFEDRALLYFDVSSEDRVALGAMKVGDLLVFAADGQPFGQVVSTKALGENGEAVSGSIRAEGLQTDAGFLTEKGEYLLPYESYTVTNGQYTITLRLTQVTVETERKG